MKHLALIGLALILTSGCGPSNPTSIEDTNPNSEAAVTVDLGETLEMVGHIGTEKNGIGSATLNSWQDAYKSKPELEHAPPRPSRDPSTGKNVPLEMPPEQRAVKRGDEWVALFGWNSMADDSNESGIVTVRVSPDAESEMIELAKELADKMESEFVATQ